MVLTVVGNVRFAIAANWPNGFFASRNALSFFFRSTTSCLYSLPSVIMRFQSSSVLNGSRHSTAHPPLPATQSLPASAAGAHVVPFAWYRQGDTGSAQAELQFIVRVAGVTLSGHEKDAAAVTTLLIHVALTATAAAPTAVSDTMMLPVLFRSRACDAHKGRRCEEIRGRGNWPRCRCSSRTPCRVTARAKQSTGRVRCFSRCVSNATFQDRIPRYDVPRVGYKCAH